jgi:nitric oxide dioxygenase
MTSDQIQLVQSSFARLAGHADDVAQAFYQRLLDLDPALRPLFPQDLSAQRAKLMQMLAAAVRGLADLPALLPVVQSLGERHGRYGVQPRHYATVGTALIETLRAGLGRDFTPALEQAWSAVYTALASAMQSGAARPELAEVA